MDGSMMTHDARLSVDLVSVQGNQGQHRPAGVALDMFRGRDIGNHVKRAILGPHRFPGRGCQEVLHLLPVQGPLNTGQGTYFGGIKAGVIAPLLQAQIKGAIAAFRCMAGTELSPASRPKTSASVMQSPSVG